MSAAVVELGGSRRTRTKMSPTIDAHPPDRRGNHRRFEAEVPRAPPFAERHERSIGHRPGSLEPDRDSSRHSDHRRYPCACAQRQSGPGPDPSHRCEHCAREEPTADPAGRQPRRVMPSTPTIVTHASNEPRRTARQAPIGQPTPPLTSRSAARHGAEGSLVAAAPSVLKPDQRGCGSSALRVAALRRDAIMGK